MNLPALLLLFSGMALTACSQTRSTTKQTPKSTTASTPAAMPQISAVKMSRGACFGKCPTYDVEVMQSGLVRYTGRRFVKSEGVYEKTFGTAQVTQLLQQFSAARLDTMQDEYRQLVSDLPSISYSIRYTNGTGKNIQNANYGPPVLVSLADAMDAFIGDVNYTWKKTAAKAE